MMNITNGAPNEGNRTLHWYNPFLLDGDEKEAIIYKVLDNNIGRSVLGAAYMVD
eukprot:CAMPEP_0203655912 /NCGR_PEP_ID=MMETSP0088-20131115/39656_1 /ASSEMBLY_ACC=CAM_ASM_001087 /TAXON_ID=426623 /ORGANISM="Chaetoceros affinis, Strain CCMP159" /LENGTH=53 /DNA_ID=CAMNT_0050516689 /DNA_START=19 /DNA_END=180 /DNA_ORIENTATION=+